MECFQIAISKSYTQVEWQEDLKKFCRVAGGEGKPVVFLFSDSKIKEESYVEDINNLLNSGEVPNLFPYDERAAVMEMCRVQAKKAGEIDAEGNPSRTPRSCGNSSSASAAPISTSSCASHPSARRSASA